MKYYLNENSGTLHIDDYCTHVRPAPKEYLRFDSEQDAYSYGGLSIKLCKLCHKRREQILKENK